MRGTVKRFDACVCECVCELGWGVIAQALVYLPATSFRVPVFTGNLLPGLQTTFVLFAHCPSIFGPASDKRPHLPWKQGEQRA